MKTLPLPGIEPEPAPAPEPGAAREQLAAALFEPDSGSSADADLSLAWSGDASLEDACRRAEEAALESRIGGSVGPYRLTALLGRGGMGAVYAAERSDGEFEQRVALKLVQGGARGPQLAARFRRERAILARLEHVNIARLIDGGLSDEGELWFAMERVEGESLAGYCERHALGLEARLRLFLEICDAVAFAHANLVVHRDLKPPNVMVTEEGRAKLLDFGIAKLVGPGDEREELTRQDERVLTPDYAAPEQVLGQPITTATDVYALGLLLYEVLTGERAQRLGSLSALDAARVIAERDPPRASAAAIPFARALAGDLDAIVAKALRKEPGRRYVGAQALGDDLRRYLSGHPVVARADTWSYRAGKFARRHRIGLAATSAVLVALLAGLVAALWQAREAQLQAERTATVKEFVIDMFRSVDPRTNERGGRDVTAHALVDGGVERLRARLGAQPEDRAELLLALSDLYWGLGDTDNALALGREALAIHRELYGSGDPGLLPALGRVVQGVAGGRTESIALIGEADELLERAGPAYDDDRLRVLQAHLLLANRDGDFRASESVAQRILALQERRYGPDAPEVGVGLVALGWAYSWQNRYQEAERLYRRALAVLGPGHNAPAFGSTRDVRFQLGSLALFQGRYDVAEREFQEVLAEVTKRLGPDHFYIRSIRQMLAFTAFNLGRAEEAETELRALSAEAIKNQAPESQRYPAWPLGRVLAGRGKMEEAVFLLRTMLEWTERASGAQAKFTQFVKRDLGAALIETGDLAEAGTVLERAMAELDRIETRESYQYALVESRYARLLLARGDAAGAEVRARHAWTVLRERMGEDYDETARAAHELGRALVALERRNDGVALLSAAAQNYEQHFGGEDVRTAEYRFVLGEALLATAPGEARQLLDGAARVLVAAEGNTLPVRTRAERWLAALPRQR